MRDPNRIKLICCLVERVWREDFPDLRFMQLMSDFALWYGADPFYMEDDVFVTKFLDFVAAMKGKKD
jgi:hypothetical protein